MDIYMTELQGQTSECMFGTTTPCMTSSRMGYSTPGVSTVVPMPDMQGSSTVHLVEEGWQVFVV
jgi:hypothetical protein